MLPYSDKMLTTTRVLLPNYLSYFVVHNQLQGVTKCNLVMWYSSQSTATVEGRESKS
jgi:hypothetical protein